MPVQDGCQSFVLMSVNVTRKPYNRTLLRDSGNGAYQVERRSCGSIGNVVRVKALLKSRKTIAFNLNLAAGYPMNLTNQRNYQDNTDNSLQYAL